MQTNRLIYLPQNLIFLFDNTSTQKCQTKNLPDNLLKGFYYFILIFLRN